MIVRDGLGRLAPSQSEGVTQVVPACWWRQFGLMQLLAGAKAVDRPGYLPLRIQSDAQRRVRVCIVGTQLQRLPIRKDCLGNPPSIEEGVAQIIVSYRSRPVPLAHALDCKGEQARVQAWSPS